MDALMCPKTPFLRFYCLSSSGIKLANKATNMTNGADLESFGGNLLCFANTHNNKKVREA